MKIECQCPCTVGCTQRTSKGMAASNDCPGCRPYRLVVTRLDEPDMTVERRTLLDAHVHATAWSVMPAVLGIDIVDPLGQVCWSWRTGERFRLTGCGGSETSARRPGSAPEAVA